MIFLYLFLTTNCAEKIIQLPISLESFVENLSAERLKELKDARQENKVLKAWLMLKHPDWLIFDLTKKEEEK